jgi:ubiquinol oxidase
MEHRRDDEAFEALAAALCDDEALRAYKEPYDNYHISFVPRMLGKFLVASGNLVYGHAPTYLKFRAIEVIARVPYHSWESAMFTLLTFFYTKEEKAMDLSNLSRFARLAKDNETMHVVVISHLAKEVGKSGFIRHTFIPLLFAFFYFWWSYILYFINPRYSFELNYIFEQHAFDSYSEFLKAHEEKLKDRRVSSEFLEWYGRYPRNQYEFFCMVRNDEIIHRNSSVHEIEEMEEVKRASRMVID